MKIAVRSNAYYRKWHRRFAWFPVFSTQDTHVVCLRTVERRDTCSQAAAWMCAPLYVYRTL